MDTILTKAPETAAVKDPPEYVNVASPNDPYESAADANVVDLTGDKETQTYLQKKC